MKSFIGFVLLAVMAAFAVAQSDPSGCLEGTIERCCTRLDEIETVNDTLSGPPYNIDTTDLTGVVGENCTDPVEGTCEEDIDYVCCDAEQPSSLFDSIYTINCDGLASEEK